MAHRTNRNLERKHQIGLRQRREAALQEYTKGCYTAARKPIVPSYPMDMVRVIPENITRKSILRMHF